MAVPTGEEGFWPFGLMEEPVEYFSGITSEETGGSNFMIEEGSVEEVKLPRRIARGMAARP